MGHHAQQPLLHPQALDQGFVFLTQHQHLVFQLQLPLGTAAIHLGGPQAHAQVTDHLQLLPTGQPALQLIQHRVARQHLPGWWLQFHQGRGGHQPVQLQQLGSQGGVGHLQSHLEAAVAGFEVMEHAAQIRGSEVVGGRHQQQFQGLPTGRGAAPGAAPGAAGKGPGGSCAGVGVPRFGHLGCRRIVLITLWRPTVSRGLAMTTLWPDPTPHPHLP